MGAYTENVGFDGEGARLGRKRIPLSAHRARPLRKTEDSAASTTGVIIMPILSSKNSIPDIVFGELRRI